MLQVKKSKLSAEIANGRLVAGHIRVSGVGYRVWSLGFRVYLTEGKTLAQKP